MVDIQTAIEELNTGKIEFACKEDDCYTTEGEVVIFLKRLAELEKADVEEVKHGEWIPTNDDNKKLCSRCDVIHLIAQYPNGQANYCPNCGAKMDVK